jgi:hypothetical protein
MELHRLQVEPERMDIALRFVSMKDRAGLPRPLRAVAFSTKSQVGVPLLGSSTLTRPTR